MGTISAFAYRHRETKKNLCPPIVKFNISEYQDPKPLFPLLKSRFTALNQRRLSHMGAPILGGQPTRNVALDSVPAVNKEVSGHGAIEGLWLHYSYALENSKSTCREPYEDRSRRGASRCILVWWLGLTHCSDTASCFNPPQKAGYVDFRGYNVGHTVSRLTVSRNMRRFFWAVTVLKHNKQETSADQTLLASSLCHFPLILNSWLSPRKVLKMQVFKMFIFKFHPTHAVSVLCIFVTDLQLIAIDISWTAKCRTSCTHLTCYVQMTKIFTGLSRYLTENTLISHF